MRRLVFVAALSAAMFAGAPAFAQSHAHSGGDAAATVQTTPSDGAMGSAPSAFSANFEHPMRLTNLVITPRGGDPIAVQVPQAQASTSVSVPLPSLAPGNYTFAWTATGADNHTMTGRVRYMVH